MMRARNQAQGGNAYCKKPPMEKFKLERLISDPDKMWTPFSIDTLLPKPKDNREHE
jgi:hypothetical protein